MAAMVVKMLMKTMANDDDQGCRDWRSPYGDNVYQEGLKFDDPAPEVSCWTVAGERQSTQLRSLYLEAVLRQDIAFFDVEMTTAEAISRMSADTVLIQDARF